MKIITLATVPSQTLNIVLGGQICQITIYQKSTGLYFDLIANNAPVITCRICRDAVPLVNTPSSGFQGEFIFGDTQGTEDPYYAGFGSRWFLLYLEASEL